MELKKKNWQQITINDYMELQDIIIREEAVDVEVGIVALLCGVDEDEIGDLSIVEYQRLRREAQFIATFPEVHNKAPKNITIGDKKYDVVTNMRKLTTAQYIDFQTYLKMGDGVNNLPNLLSAFIVPKGSKYGDESYNIDKLKNDIKEYLPVTTAFEMCGFFQKAFLNSIKNILFYLELKMRKVKTEKEKEVKKALQEIRLAMRGGGFTKLTQ